MEEGRPVYVGTYLLQRVVVERLHAEDVRLRRGVTFPVDLRAIGARTLQGREFRLRAASLVLAPDLLVVGGDLLGVSRPAALARQVLDHADGARGVLYVDHGLLVAGCDLDGRVRLGGGSPADEQRYIETFALHLFGIVNHLIQRRRYEAGEPDDVG